MAASNCANCAGGLIPWFRKKTVKEWKPLTTNAGSETIETTASFKSAFTRRRCLIAVSSFYEWTGEKGKKTKWRAPCFTPGPTRRAMACASRGVK